MRGTCHFLWSGSCAKFSCLPHLRGDIGGGENRDCCLCILGDRFSGAMQCGLFTSLFGCQECRQSEWIACTDYQGHPSAAIREKVHQNFGFCHTTILDPAQPLNIN
jgi:hypothetical protein